MSAIQGVKTTSNIVRPASPQTNLERACGRVVAWKVAELSTNEVPWSSGWTVASIGTPGAAWRLFTMGQAAVATL